MDPVTHGFAGAAISYLGFRRRAALAVLVASAVAPDLDYLTRLCGADVFLTYHRGITHGVVALFLAPAVIGAAFSRVRKNFVYYYSLAFLGYGSHLFFDLMNQYGTRVLSPLDWRQYSLNLVFIMDPYISGGLFVGVLLAAVQKKPERARAVVLAMASLMLLYLGTRHYFHERTEEFLRKNLDEYIVMDVVPMPGGILRWWFVAKGDGYIKTGFSDLFTGRIYVDGSYDAESYDPVIEATRELDVVKRFLGFAKHPYAEIERREGRVVVTWKELSYSYAPGEHFTARVVMDEKGRVLSKRFEF
jgi:inner membrane protein